MDWHYFRKVGEIIAAGWGIFATAWVLWEHFHILRNKEEEIRRRNEEIHALNAGKQNLQREINDLRDEKHVESIRLVERTLHGLLPPICPICRELLFLRLSTTFVGAIQRLTALPDAVDRAITSRRLNMPSLLNMLERSIELDLWQPSLENPADQDRHRDKPDQELITEAIGAYVALIPHMTDEERERAIQFCIRSCDNGSAVLRREAVRRLLPQLLVASRGHESLVEAYKNLFGTLRRAHTDEQKTLLIALFGGLQFAASVNSNKVGDIWMQAFQVAVTNVEWAWEGEGGAKIGTSWCIAMEDRLQHSELQEKELLRRLTGHYLEGKAAPSHRLSYRQIAQLFHKVRQSLEGTIPPFRKPDRAVVPDDKHLLVQLSINADESPLLMEAHLINFSLDATGKGHGAWATADGTEWPPGNQWRDAKVTIVMPEEGRVAFHQARVLGPIQEGDGNHRYYGFRIQLGEATPEDAVAPLKRRWDIWDKR